jgi:hypothetical protein
VAHFRNRNAALPRAVNAGLIRAYTKTANRDQSIRTSQDIRISSCAIVFKVNSRLWALRQRPPSLGSRRSRDVLQEPSSAIKSAALCLPLTRPNGGRIYLSQAPSGHS